MDENELYALDDHFVLFLTIMHTHEFTTDVFRDLTFDLLSGIAHDPTKFDEYTTTYLTKLHERQDEENLKKYTREIYAKLLRNFVFD